MTNAFKICIERLQRFLFQQNNEQNRSKSIHKGKDYAMG